MTDRQAHEARRDRQDKRATLYAANGEADPFQAPPADRANAGPILARLCLWLTCGLVLVAFFGVLVAATLEAAMLAAKTFQHL